MLNKILKDKNLTQQKLADLLGIHQTAVSQWVNKKSKPSIKTLYKLSDVLELDFNETANLFK